MLGFRLEARSANLALGADKLLCLFVVLFIALGKIHFQKRQPRVWQDAVDAAVSAAESVVDQEAARLATDSLSSGIMAATAGRDRHEGDCANFYYCGPNNNKLYHLYFIW